jgi:hypothetical protein
MCGPVLVGQGSCPAGEKSRQVELGQPARKLASNDEARQPAVRTVTNTMEATNDNPLKSLFETAAGKFDSIRQRSEPVLQALAGSSAGERVMLVRAGRCRVDLFGEPARQLVRTKAVRRHK